MRQVKAVSSQLECGTCTDSLIYYTVGSVHSQEQIKLQRGPCSLTFYGRSLGLTDKNKTRARLKDIVSKPQFVVHFQRDINLLLYPDVVDKSLWTEQHSELTHGEIMVCS